jgi:hypothetical protein
MNTMRIHDSTRPSARFAGSAVMLAVLLVAAAPAFAASDVPHRARGAGALVAEPIPIAPSEEFPFGALSFVAHGQGVGTHEGRFTEINEFVMAVVPFEGDLATLIEGTLRVFAADGDELLWAFSSLSLGIPEFPFDFEGSALLVDGTGRFEGGSGLVTTRGTLNADGSYEYEARGRISSVGSNVTSGE